MNNHPSYTPTFTVITVTFNAEDTLERTLRSVAAQTYPHIEYLVIDGKSKDNTLKIAERYNHCISRIVSEPDKGLYDAMNKGIRLATGDYLCFLNAGDKLHSAETLQQVADSLKEGRRPDVIYGQTAIVDDDGNFLRMRRLSAPEHLGWKSFRQGMLVCHQSFWPSKTLAQAMPYDMQYRFSADFDWCIRIMKKSALLHHTHLTLVDYLNEGMTTRNHKASLKERFRIMTLHYGWLSTVLHHIWFVFRALLKK